MSTVTPGSCVDFRTRILPYANPPARRAAGPLPFRLAPEMAGLFHGQENLHILEIGCGPAQNRPYFSARGHRYVGLDLADSRADVQADAIALPFADGTFDAVITIATLQYTLDPLRFLAEARRVLRPGGTITGTAAFLEPWTYGGMVQLTPGGLVMLLKAAGFDIRNIWPGWSGDVAIGVCACAPARRLGLIFGNLQFLLHQSWWRGLNAARRLTGRPARNRLLQELEFAGSINFHAVRPLPPVEAVPEDEPLAGTIAPAGPSPTRANDEQ